MRSNIVFALTGPDRVGIVEKVTGMLLDLGGNVETSRMARLGGEFTMLMLVSLPQEHAAALEEVVAALSAQGYRVTTSPTKQTYAEMHPGWLPFHIEVEGADHEGIIHQVARHLAERGINIESMETGVVHAPVSGTPIFTMTAIVAVPPGLAGQGWQTALHEAGAELNVEIKVSPLEKH